MLLLCEAKCALLKSVPLVQRYAVCKLVYLQFIQRVPFIVSLRKAALSLTELTSTRTSRDSLRAQDTVRLTHSLYNGVRS
jgi:hypothetical protein